MKTVVVGVGEVGTPLLELIREAGLDAQSVDIDPVEITDTVDTMHICVPFKDKDPFVETAVNYIKKYNPALTIIESTVVPGTTREIAEKSGKPVVHSPVRGLHKNMKEDLKFYTKYIGTDNAGFGEKAAQHYQKLGMKTRILDKPEKSEFIKLLSTSYYGLLIGWAQEVNRVCKENELDYNEIMSFAEEIEKRGHPRPVMKPEPIGGHCVIQNIQILKKVVDSDYIDAVLKSNEWIKRDIGEKNDQE